MFMDYRGTLLHVLQIYKVKNGGFTLSLSSHVKVIDSFSLQGTFKISKRHKRIHMKRSEFKDVSYNMGIQNLPQE